MTKFSYRSKLGKLMAYLGEWMRIAETKQPVFVSKCGKVFVQEDYRVYLAGSLNTWDEVNQCWKQLTEESIFKGGVYMGVVE